MLLLMVFELASIFLTRRPKICRDRRGVFAYLCFVSRLYACYLHVCPCLAACL